MIRLSVNINKVAVLRNSRGGNLPDLLQVAKDCESYGAQGITVHPRPDQRHIRYSDVPALKEVVKTEFNIEGFPNDKFMQLVLDNRPDQCTLVPDPPGVLTSDTGWDTIKDVAFLREIVATLQKQGIRVSLFMDPDEKLISAAADTGTDRIELYTGKYAKMFVSDSQAAVAEHSVAARTAGKLGLGVNAGHDLNLENLTHYAQNVPGLLEVSIGHALICDALYFGLHNVIEMYSAILSDA